MNLNAQSNILDNYEIGLSGSAGLSALHFKTADGNKPTYSVGYAFGWDIAVLFSEQWAVRTGVSMGSYRSSVSFDHIETRNIISSPPGMPKDSRFIRVSDFYNYEESHEALYLHFPLMAQYRFSTSANKHLYVAAGFQTSILANSVYSIHSDEAVTKSYSDYTMVYYEGLPDLGFDTYSKIKSVNKPDFGISIAGVLETGIRMMFSNGTAMYASVFMDYGLNDIRKNTSSKHSIVYGEEGTISFNTLINAQNDGKPVINKVLPVSVGLRLRWSMMFRR